MHHQQQQANSFQQYPHVLQMQQQSNQQYHHGGPENLNLVHQQSTEKQHFPQQNYQQQQHQQPPIQQQQIQHSYQQQHDQQPQGYQQQLQQQSPQQPPTQQQSSPGDAAARTAAGFKMLISEMKAKNFDKIRFAAYRTANKLRYIQLRTQFVHLDIWNVIEAFRQTGLHTVDPGAQLDRVRIEETLQVMLGQLNLRLPASRQIQAEECSDILLAWLLHSYDKPSRSQIRVLALKVALSTLASGKPVDKFKYHFTLLSDPSGALVPSKFEQYLHDLLVLATGVFEGSNFVYDQQSSRFMLAGKSRNIVIEEFLERMLSDPGPQCLLWLTIFHRLAHVYMVRHAVRCEGCRRENIAGFRYKCSRCHHYNLCQECFWTGITSGSHTNQHDMKEYTSSKSHSRQFGHSLRKSFHCGKPGGRGHRSQDGPGMEVGRGSQRRRQGSFTESPVPSNRAPELMYIVPPTPPALRAVTQLSQTSQSGMMGSSSQPSIQAATALDRNMAAPSPSRSMGGPVVTSVGSHGNGNHHSNRLDSAAPVPAPRRPNSFPFDPNRIDDEHKLIARYAQRLAADTNGQQSRRSNDTTMVDGILVGNDPRAQKELIMKLESKNRDILREIHRLKQEQLAASNGGMPSPSSSTAASGNPTLMGELRALRQRKDELENRMGNLQDSRKELMQQLESLMRLLKTNSAANSATGSLASVGSGPGAAHFMPGNGLTTSLRSSPAVGTGSPLRVTKLAGVPAGVPMRSINNSLSDSGGYLSNVLGYSHTQTTTDASGRALRHDLLLAADSVTHAMSSLVRELNSEASSEEDRLHRASGAPVPGSSHYEADYERALDGAALGNGPETANTSTVVSNSSKATTDYQMNAVMANRLLTEQRFLQELQARRNQQNPTKTQSDVALGNTNGNNGSLSNSGNHGNAANVASSGWVSHQRTNSYASQDSESEAYLYSDPECAMRTDDEMSGGGQPLHNRQPRYRRYAAEEETDHESYIRTDDEEGGNTDWEDNMRRWVNR